MTKRILTVIMAIGMAVAVLLCGSGCKEKILAYNAKLVIDYCEDERRAVPTDVGVFSRNFWRENMVRVIYLNEDYDSDSSVEREYQFDSTLPEKITHTVTTEKDYKHVFNSEYRYANEPLFDFEKEMLIVYVYRGDASNVKTYLQDVRLNDMQLEIEYKQKRIKYSCAEPKRRVLVIKIEKIEFEDVQLIPL